MKNSTAKRLKQVPEGYLIIGVDPYKKKHAVVVMTQNAIVQTKFKFSNSRGGFEEVLQRARAEMLNTGSKGVIFAIETASHYWRNLGNFLCRLCLPKAINDWSLRSLQVKLIKIGGRIVRHTRRFVFQLAEVAVSRDLFAALLERITRLSLSPG